MPSQQNNIRYGLVLLSISVILTFFLLISNANGYLSQQFFDVFFPITIGVTVIWGVLLFLETKNKLRGVFGFNEQVLNSPFSKFPLSVKILVIGGGLAILFSAGAIGLGSPIIDIPQPFTEQAFTQVTDFDKVVYQSVIPGFFEESAIYVIALATKFILFMALGRNPKLLLMIMLIASGVGAFVLTQAHRLVYGSDQGAFIGIFLFSFTVTFFNLYTGAFISWIPHMLHNAVVVLGFLVAFSIGGTKLLRMFGVKNEQKS